MQPFVITEHPNKYMKTIRAISFLFFTFLFSIRIFAGNDYQYSIDLNTVTGNKIQVTLIPPDINQDEIIFRLPRMVPGTYHIYDFGRFITEFNAYDNSGSELSVSRLDSNSWKISGKNIAKITYFAEESWTTKNPNNKIFEPAGMNLQKQSNFVLNAQCLFGYFDGMREKVFTLTVTKPDNYYGSTALIPEYSDKTMDRFSVQSYSEMTDSPIMYDVPDTTIVKLGETNVLVSVYSPNHLISSKTLAKSLGKMLEGQRKYLGGNLPVKKYAYLYYFVPPEMKRQGSFGALEHNNSSLYFLPEAEEKDMDDMLISTAAHEFFHVITPLSIHSEEIQNFDFDNPKMSEHLWLYEGVTEYTAIICQVKEGLISRDEFLNKVQEKIIMSAAFNDTLPFTEMSKNVLDKYVNEYTNVYQKGALIGMCLDIKLRALSNGQFGIRDMMKILSERYGKYKSFEDSGLFDEITSFTFPEIRNFFRLYVEGNKPLPYDSILSMAGVFYSKKSSVKEFTLGRIGIAGRTGDSYMEVVGTDNANDFGKEMGYKKEDKIIKINGIDTPYEKFKEVLNSVYKKSKEGDIMKLVVLRKDKNGEEKEVTLKAKMYKVDVQEENYIALDENANKQQVLVRDSWLGENN
jgi:predicted metalloprotease with PDZ domain